MAEIRNVTTSPAILGQVLAGARNARGLKQSDIGAALGIGASSWSRIEKGDSFITYEQLRSAAKALKMSVGEIDEIVLAAEREAVSKGVEVDNAVARGNGYNKSAAGGAFNGAAGVIAYSAIIPVVGAVLAGVIDGALIAIWNRSSKENNKT